jgi:spermidine synthase
VHDDVSNVLRKNVGGFNAIMLDTDNGPEGMIMKENSRLYAVRGIANTMAALRPNGTIAYWSVGDDPDFERSLQNAGLQVKAMKVRAHATSGPYHTLYIAT